MDNSNLDAKTPRLNPYDAPAGQKKQKREKLPPPPMETAVNQAPYQTQNSPAPSVGSYPAAMGAMEPSMPGMAGMPSAMQPMTPAMPGMPTGISAAEATGLAPLTPFNQPIPVTTESTLYINGFLRTMIGRKVTVEFLIGTNTFTDRTGVLLAVGANYIVINEVETDDILICDFFSIKFVKVYY